MTIKLTGAEWNRFYQDSSVWVEGASFDDVRIEVDGVDVDGYYNIDELDPAQKVVVEGGGFYLNGAAEGICFESVIRNWRNAQRLTILVVEVDKGKVEPLVNAIKANGGRVVK